VSNEMSDARREMLAGQERATRIMEAQRHQRQALGDVRADFDARAASLRPAGGEAVALHYIGGDGPSSRLVEGVYRLTARKVVSYFYADPREAAGQFVNFVWRRVSGEGPEVSDRLSYAIRLPGDAGQRQWDLDSASTPTWGVVFGPLFQGDLPDVESEAIVSRPVDPLESSDFGPSYRRSRW